MNKWATAEHEDMLNRKQIGAGNNKYMQDGGPGLLELLNPTQSIKGHQATARKNKIKLRIDGED